MNIDFIKGKIKKIDLEITKSFGNLPADKNDISKGFYYRHRRFSRLFLKNHDFKVDNNANFYQSKKLNRFAGGQIRKFENITNKTLEKIILLINNNFLEFLHVDKNYEIGVHQLRIKCGKSFVGYPVPEGWHQDGFDKIIILNINSENITGGTTRLKKKINSDKDDFSFFLKIGEFVFLDDKKYNHYTDPINIYNEKKTAYRDTFVFTIKLLTKLRK